MNRAIKGSCITVMLVVSLQSAKPQEAFIDSIRFMLIDLDSSIQFSSINNLLKRNILYCSGNKMNDSLNAGIRQLVSDNYILSDGLQQAVSPHLLKRYHQFLLRICTYIDEFGPANEHNENMMRVAKLIIRSPEEEAVNYAYDHARNILSQIHFTDSFKVAEWFYCLSQTYFEGYKPDSSIILITQSLLQNPNNTQEEKIFYAKTFYRLGTFYYESGKRDSAFVVFQKHLALRKIINGESTSEYAYWLIVTADQYTYLAKYDLALSLDFKAQQIIKNTIGEQTSQYALCLNGISELYYRTGEYFKSLPYALQSLAIKRKIFGNGYFDNVVSLHNLATLYTRMGLYNEAIPLLEESLNISKKYFGEKLVYSFDLHPLAEVYTYLGEYDKALPLYLKSRQIQRNLQAAEGGSEKNVYYPGILHSIAALYTKFGQYDKAIELFEHALVLKKQVYGELNPEYTKTLNSYAETCLLKKDFKKALSLQLQSTSLTKKLFGELHPNLAAGLLNLASFYLEQNNLLQARQYASKALHIQIQIFGSMHPDVATTFDILGNISRRAKQYATALNYFQKAFEIRKRTMAAIHPSYISSLYNLGNIYMKQGKFRKAAALFIQADSNALHHIEQSYITLSEEEKLVYLRNMQRNFYYLPSLLYRQKITSPAITNRIFNDAIVLKSMILFQQKAIYNSVRMNSDSNALGLYRQWRLDKSFLGRQLLLQPSKRQYNFDSISEVTNELEETLSRVSSLFEKNSFRYGTDLNEIRSNLSKEDAAIEFIRFKLSGFKQSDSIVYAAVVVMPGRTNAKFIPLCGEKQLKTLLRFSNNTGPAAVAYLYPSSGRETPVSRKLYHLIWQPLELLLKNVHTIYYSPTGLLLKLSFGALHDGNGKFLSDTYHLKQMVSTRTLALKQETGVKLISASIWGGIDYDHARSATSNDSVIVDTASFPGLKPYEITDDRKQYSTKWNALPGTKMETDSILSLMIKRHIVCSQQTEYSANETEFKRMDGNSPTLLHIATHGFFLPAIAPLMDNEDTDERNTFSNQENPMLRSGLLLAGSNAAWTSHARKPETEDGILTSYEISHLDLSNTKVATLSACETALGEIEENEGVYGLVRAFKMAGVKQVLTSLWSVPDKETNQLMLTFYNALLLGDDASTALQKAQSLMKEKYPPYYWAGFVLTE